MKHLLLAVFCMITVVSAANAQQKKGSQTVTIATPGVQCEQCKDIIERYLVREDGVQKVIVDFKHSKTKVTFYTERTNIENIKTAIANAGFDADDVTANEDSVEKLPSCCKKPK